MKAIYCEKEMAKAVKKAEAITKKKVFGRSIISKSCGECRMLFEAFSYAPKDPCPLCRYEKAENKKEWLENQRNKTTEEGLYKIHLARGIALHNRKVASMKKMSCTVKKPSCSWRLLEYDDFLEKY